ncbi:hypothetical protein BH09PAT2_BH09PAT2_06880 [soil metagenome]
MLMVNNGSPFWDDYRTTDWMEMLEYPEVTLRQCDKFLAYAN